MFNSFYGFLFTRGSILEGYFDHLKLNMIILKCLIFKTEHECTHEFHKTKWKKYFRWQYK